MSAIARLEVTLDHVEPVVLRRIEVPLDMALDRLHLVLQAAIGWTDSHLYELRARDVGWSTPFPGQDSAADVLDARKATLGQVLEGVRAKTLKYLYDFGDGWEHTIKIERLIDPEPDVLYPRLIEAKGRCPPEDIGGPWGYAELLEALADPRHERHRELKDWLEDEFDPNVVDVDALANQVAALARHWSRKSPSKSRRRR
ncbi:MAG: plasmid pRiA4b ORF-3 family protein [Hyphomicrobiales bacterium]|nr:plasmid pRiA4b ORF-3 family protein [Hyphomicrobiales bacterium]